MKTNHNYVTVSRTTNETDISISLNQHEDFSLTGSSGIGFLDHMLDTIAKHGELHIELKCKSDLHVDDHHTVEDIGIIMGQALSDMVGDRKSIARFGTSYIPLDEALSRCVIDFGGRAYLIFNVNFTREAIGELSTELIEEFFKSLAFNMKANIHLENLHGTNNHHICETLFKAFARSLKQSMEIRNSGQVLSTKGVLV